MSLALQEELLAAIRARPAWRSEPDEPEPVLRPTCAVRGCELATVAEVPGDAARPARHYCPRRGELVRRLLAGGRLRALPRDELPPLPTGRVACDYGRCAATAIVELRLAPGPGHPAALIYRCAVHARDTLRSRWEITGARRLRRDAPAPDGEERP